MTLRLQERRHDPGRLVMVALAFALVGCGPSGPEPPRSIPQPGNWREFEGAWNAAGTRRTIPLGEQRRAAILDLRGTILLAGAGRPGVGFRSEVIALTDTKTGIVGRSVWTDERGDQIFSELEGASEAASKEHRIAAKFLGGTGRYAGATGTYDFSWHYLIELDDGTVQGSTADVKGRIRFDGPSADGSPQ